MSRFIRTAALFVVLNGPFWILYLVWGQGLRVATILLCFAAMWSLWTAKRDRGDIWTSKMFKIWLVQIGWCTAAVEGNLELYYREVRPSFAVLIVVGLLWLTIRGVFDTNNYTTDQH